MDLDDLPAVGFDPDIRDNSSAAASAELSRKKEELIHGSCSSQNTSP